MRLHRPPPRGIATTVVHGTAVAKDVLGQDRNDGRAGWVYASWGPLRGAGNSDKAGPAGEKIAVARCLPSS